MRLHQSGDPEYEQSIIRQKGQEWYENLRRRGREIIKVNKGYYEEVYKEMENKTWI